VQAGNGLCGDPAYCGNEVRTAAAPEGRAAQLVWGGAELLP
jgi:hypothetical protein